MNGPREEKLKLLLARIPPGFLVDSTWMTKHGISRSSTHDYVRRQWLEPVSRGVYRRPFSLNGDPDAARDWKIPVLSAQQIMGYDLHVGGLTTLALSGHVHYLPLGGKETVYLYSERPPSWLTRIPLTARLFMRNPRLFEEAGLGVDNTDVNLSGNSNLALSPWQWPLKASSAERAILEALDELPDNESFHTLDTIFESLANLRPRRLTALLKSCRKVQVKRLFFVFADKHAHAWRRHISPSEVDLGSGDRAFYKGGKLHPIYRITVPPEFLPQPARVADGP
jgi:hypothetical protein